MRSLTKVISGLKIHVLIAIVAIFAVACGGDNGESAGTTAGSSVVRRRPVRRSPAQRRQPPNPRQPTNQQPYKVLKSTS